LTKKEHPLFKRMLFLFTHQCAMLFYWGLDILSTTCKNGQLVVIVVLLQSSEIINYFPALESRKKILTLSFLWTMSLAIFGLSCFKMG